VASDDQPCGIRKNLDVEEDGDNEEEMVGPFVLGDQEMILEMEDMSNDIEAEDTFARSESARQRLINEMFQQAIMHFTSLTMTDLSIFRGQAIPYGPSTNPIELRHLMDLALGESLTVACMDAYLNVFRVTFPFRTLDSSAPTKQLVYQKALTKAMKLKKLQYDLFRSYLGKDDKQVLIPFEQRKTWDFIYIDGTQSLISVRSIHPLNIANSTILAQHAARIRTLCERGCTDPSSPFFSNHVLPPDKLLDREAKALLPREYGTTDF